MDWPAHKNIRLPARKNDWIGSVKTRVDRTKNTRRGLEKNINRKDETVLIFASGKRRHLLGSDILRVTRPNVRFPPAPHYCFLRKTSFKPTPKTMDPSSPFFFLSSHLASWDVDQDHSDYFGGPMPNIWLVTRHSKEDNHPTIVAAVRTKADLKATLKNLRKGTSPEEAHFESEGYRVWDPQQAKLLLAFQPSRDGTSRYLRCVGSESDEIEAKMAKIWGAKDWQLEWKNQKVLVRRYDSEQKVFVRAVPVTPHVETDPPANLFVPNITNHWGDKWD